MSFIYLDNAATTALSEEVLDKMLPYLKGNYGNPSAIYSIGRINRLAIEESRKNVAKLLGAKASEIFFTSCGTESSNTVLQSAVNNMDCIRIISSPIEHPATLNTLKTLVKYNNVQLDYVKLTNDHQIDFDHLEILLKTDKGKTLVSLMHANNEIGNLLDLKRTSTLCKKYKAFFHTDMVQTIGHYEVNLNELGIDFASGSAHKFHGPKGSGLLYISANVKIEPLIMGGGQERNMRAGTENVANIVGFSTALSFALERIEEDQQYVMKLKQYCLDKILELFGSVVKVNSHKDGLYTVLNISFPANEKTEMLQMALDMKGICVSGGSACSSGAAVGSHVINYINSEANVPLRISFSKHNTHTEIDQLVSSLKELLA